MTEQEFRNVPVYRGGVKACIFDWAGTVVDAGVFAPVLTFQKLFEDEGVPISSEEVRAPMGVHKRVSEATYVEDLMNLKYFSFTFNKFVHCPMS